MSFWSEHAFGNLLTNHFKTFIRRRKCFKEMKIPSYTYKMFFNTLFYFCCSFLQLSRHKSPIHIVEFSFHRMIFQSKAYFYLFTPFFFNNSSKMDRFCFSKHFLRLRFNFHVMNAKSFAQDLISNIFYSLLTGI